MGLHNQSNQLKLKGRTISAGFTLLEVLVVIGAVGILCAIVAPSWLTFLNVARLNKAQEQVYRGMREAQDNAKRTKAFWQFSLREQNEIAQIAIHPAATNPSVATWIDLDPNIRVDPETTYPLLSSGIRRVEFGSKGEVKTIPLGRITLSVKQGGKAKRCVFVSTILGALRMSKERPQPDQDGKSCY
jgi:prepilin-type N-terminal cleavage/methylation domain-containing protein